MFARQIDEIRMSRHECEGHCPVDELVLRRDSSAAYSGFADVPRVGEYTAHLRLSDFAALAAFIDQRGFNQLPDEIGGWGDDMSWEVISLTRGGVKKSVTVQHYQPPTALDDVVERLAVFGSSLSWSPMDSGIDAQMLEGTAKMAPGPPSKWSLPSYYVTFTRDGATTRYVVVTDAAGHVRAALPPGTYTADSSQTTLKIVVRPHTYIREPLVFLADR